MRIKGQGVSKGYGIGYIYRYDTSVVIPSHQITQVEEALKHLSLSIEACTGHLETLYQESVPLMGEDKAQLFRAHALMLEDPEYVGQIRDKIQKGTNPAQAVSETSKVFEEIFLSMDNAYFRERAADVVDVSERLIYHLMGKERKSLKTLPKDSILVSHDLSPSDTAQLDKANIQGIITEIGGETSHSAIIARSLGIPAVMGIGHQSGELDDGLRVILDGDQGLIIPRPDMEIAREYEKKILRRQDEQASYQKFQEATFSYNDGRKIEIAGNIASPEEADQILSLGGQGIGLFRSEFIFMNRQAAPGEEEQYRAYKQALEALKGHPVTIRTMDIGGDKPVDYLDIGQEMNPFLGYRAIRYCFDHLDFFKTQLRALYRASVHGKLRIMFPMVSAVEEVKSLFEILEDVKSELVNEGFDFDDAVEVGVMIEVPSAAMMSDVFASYFDFASIGTNDLTQYTLASDRMNPMVKHLYSNYDPAVIRLIHMTIENFHRKNKWVGMCGSAAGNTDLIPLWYAMGLDEFSMTPQNILEAKAVINGFSEDDSEKLLEQIMACESKTEIMASLKQR